jgi:hypothetical protein
MAPAALVRPRSLAGTSNYRLPSKLPPGRHGPRSVAATGLLVHYLVLLLLKISGSLRAELAPVFFFPLARGDNSGDWTFNERRGSFGAMSSVVLGMIRSPAPPESLRPTRRIDWMLLPECTVACPGQ